MSVRATSLECTIYIGVPAKTCLQMHRQKLRSASAVVIIISIHFPGGGEKNEGDRNSSASKSISAS